MNVGFPATFKSFRLINAINGVDVVRLQIRNKRFHLNLISFWKIDHLDVARPFRPVIKLHFDLPWVVENEYCLEMCTKLNTDGEYVGYVKCVRLLLDRALLKWDCKLSERDKWNISTSIFELNSFSAISRWFIVARINRHTIETFIFIMNVLSATFTF